MKKFMVITNSAKDEGLALTQRIRDYIEKRGGLCDIRERESKAGTVHKINMSEEPGVECVLVLGGDGTIVRAARDMTGTPIPMIGINLGTLGYLCEIEEENVFSAIDRIMSNDYAIEDRIKLTGSVIKNGETAEAHMALNDIVIYRAGNLQIVSLDVYINGGFLCNYQADGLIVSTPTGSTAYSMSAGGPIVDPKARMTLITPVNAQAMTARSIVIPAEDEIRVEVAARTRGKAHGDERVEIAFDGDNIAELTIGESIVIRKAPEVARFLKLSSLSFIERLQKKMDGFNDRRGS